MNNLDGSHKVFYCGFYGNIPDMTLQQSVLESLKAGTSWKEIQKMTTSKSTLYKVLDEFFDWVGPKVEESQRLIREAGQELSDIKNERRNVVAEVSSKVSERGSLDDELAVLKKGIEAKKNEYQVVSDAFERVDAGYSELKGRGVTDEIVSFFTQIDFASNEDLLERIKTAESIKGLRKEENALTEKCEFIRRDVDREERQKFVLQNNVLAEKRRLDEERRRNLVYKQAVDVVQGYVKVYSPDLLLSLLEVLDNLAIPGEPETSIKRLVDGLHGIRNLEELMSACRKMETYLSEMKLERDRVTAEVEVMKDVFRALLQQLIDSGYAQFEKFVADTLFQMEAISSKLGEYEGVQRTQLETFRVNTEASFRQIGDAQRKHLNNIIVQLNNTIQRYEALVRQWGIQKQEESALAEDIAYGRIIRNVRGGNVEDLPLVVIYQLCKAVQGFIYLKMPDVRIKPMKKTADMDTNLNTYQDYSLLAIAEMLAIFFNIKAAGKNYEDFYENIWSL